MPAQQHQNESPRGALTVGSFRNRTWRFQTQILDLIVVVLTFIMLLTLLGAVGGLVLDFAAAITTLLEAAAPIPSHYLVKSLGQHLVVDVLSVFILIELFRTFADYLEFHRIRLHVLAEVGIVFVLREIFIGLYANRMDWPEILALAALLAVLAATRVAASRFPPRPQSNQ